MTTGSLKERYEYTPYGQRTVFFSAGSDDPDPMSPTLLGRRVPFAGGVNQPYGLCEFGHQGLYHDEELSLIYYRARLCGENGGIRPSAAVGERYESRPLFFSLALESKG